MRLPYKRYIATTSNQDPRLSALTLEQKNSDNFYAEILENYLHYGMVLLILYYFEMNCDCSKSAIFGAKRGGADDLCRQDRTGIGLIWKDPLMWMVCRVYRVLLLWIVVTRWIGLASMNLLN